MDDKMDTTKTINLTDAKDLINEVKTSMEKELKAAIATKVKNQVLDGLAETNDVLVPQALIDSEIDRMRREAIQQFGGQIGRAHV